MNDEKNTGLNSTEEISEEAVKEIEAEAETAAENAAVIPEVNKAAGGKKKKAMSAARARRFKYGGTATLITVIGVVVILIINMIATALTDRFGLTVDMTTESIFKLSDKTKGYIADIDKDVDIFILYDEASFKSNSIYTASAASVIESYAQNNSHIKVSYENLVQNPTFVNNFPNLTLASGNVVVSCGERAVALSLDDLVEVSYTNSGNQSYASTAEQAMTSALLTVTSDELMNVLVLTGFENGDATGVKNLFTSNNYVVDEQPITTAEISPETDIIVLYGIKTDIDKESMAKIDKFLLNEEKETCRCLMYFVSSTSPDLESMTNLNALLSDWGIEVYNDYIYETSSARMYYQAIYTIPDIVNTEVTNGLENKNLNPIMIQGRHLEIDPTNSNAENLMEYSTTARYASYEQLSDESFSANDGSAAGGCAAIACGTYTQYNGTLPCRSRVVVFSSDEAFSADTLASSYFANADYLISLSNTITDNSTSVYIASKSLDTATVVLTQSQSRLIMYAFVVIIPLVVLIAGLWVWIRRRHM